MPKYSLHNLLMWIALAAIVFALIKSEGFGRRVVYIDSLWFSADESRILVSTVSGRNKSAWYNTELKHLSRTISWLDHQNGTTIEVVHQDYEKQIPYASIDELKGTVACHPTTDRIAAVQFFGSNTTLDIQSGKWIEDLPFSARRIMFSDSGRYLAVLTLSEITVVDVAKQSAALQVPLNVLDEWRLITRRKQPNYNLLKWCKFSSDETRLVLSFENETEVWSIDEKLLTSSNKNNHNSDMIPLSQGPNQTIVASSNQSARIERRYRQYGCGNRIRILFIL